MGMAKQPKALQSGAMAVPVLVTRPLGEGQALVAQLSARFGPRVRPLLAPLMAAEFLRPNLPAGPFAAVIFTSAAGVAGAARLKANLPQRAFCVGAKTAERARKAGFLALSADGNADALVALVQASRPDGRLLHLHGQDTRGDVAGRLVSAGIETVSSIVYRQVPQPLPAEALAILQANGPVIVPLYSPRSAVLFAAALPDDTRADLHLVVISDAVAKAAARLAYRALVLAQRPDATAMLDAVAKALDSPLIAGSPP